MQSPTQTHSGNASQFNCSAYILVHLLSLTLQHMVTCKKEAQLAQRKCSLRLHCMVRVSDWVNGGVHGWEKKGVNGEGDVYIEKGERKAKSRLKKRVQEEERMEDRRTEEVKTICQGSIQPIYWSRRHGKGSLAPKLTAKQRRCVAGGADS
ncbi:unnamed protein product [Taenia asiatica]|uniref:Uncharacterized protein n=1 Tax=Taenia asiatica TaxID=60517 RepID=A0A3P6S4B7_TAEAS|nr:unnamed protein product [Taenia asiatica]